MVQDHLDELNCAASVPEQAAFWCVLLHSGDATPADQRAFGEWVQRSPDRIGAFLEATRTTWALRSASAQWPTDSVEALVAQARGGRVAMPEWPSRVDPVSMKQPEGRWFASRPRLRFAAVAIASLASVLVAAHMYFRPVRIETEVGEQRSVVLEDGSILTLNTSTVIEVQMSSSRRQLRLLAGEALFEVAHDAARPFDVQVGDATVRAVGTEFNIDRRARGTTVTVVEGRVAVFSGAEAPARLTAAQRPLTAGEQLIVAPSVSSRPVRADVATAIAWTQRKLVFERRELWEVAEEFNRYNHQFIDIRSTQLRGRLVSGVFQANDPASFIAFLSDLPGVRVEMSADRSRIVVTLEALERTL